MVDLTGQFDTQTMTTCAYSSRRLNVSRDCITARQSCLSCGGGYVFRRFSIDLGLIIDQGVLLCFD
jgi:hypothetical protein